MSWQWHTQAPTSPSPPTRPHSSSQVLSDSSQYTPQLLAIHPSKVWESEVCYPGFEHHTKETIATMLACDGCPLLEFKNSPTLFANEICNHQFRTTYELEVDRRDENHQGESSFEQFRRVLRQKLSSNETFFRQCVMDMLQSPVPGTTRPLSYKNYYLRIHIDIVPPEVDPHARIEVNPTIALLEPVDREELQKDLVATLNPLQTDRLQTKGMIAGIRSAVERDPELERELTASVKSLEGDEAQIRQFVPWRNKLERDSWGVYTGIGVAVDFTVHHHCSKKALFWVQMGLPFARQEITNLEPRLSGWENKISKAFGDTRHRADRRQSLGLF